MNQSAQGESPIDRSKLLDLESLAYQIQQDNAKSKLQKTVAILKHYPWAKIAKRGVRTCIAKLNSGKKIGAIAVPNSKPKLKLSDKLNQLAKLISGSFQDHPFHTQTNIESGSFCLLNQSVDLSNPTDWAGMASRAPSHLWRFHFHYHEYLLNANQRNNNQHRDFILEWISHYQPEQTQKSDDAWHPYCISRRIPVWLLLLYLDSGIAENTQNEILNSILQQCLYLQKNLEQDIGGNHLLENLCALAFAHCVIENPGFAIWNEKFQAILTQQMKHQTLDSGEHFELSPAYHCQVIWILLRIAVCVDPSSRLSYTSRNYAESMLNFLAAILHPDGEIPLFGDSGFYEAPSVKTLRAVADLAGFDWPQVQHENRTIGHYTIFESFSDSEHEFSILDHGPVAADELPAHGHCDLTNFELSIGNNRWIVDSGNFNYEDDSMRAYCRSSLAHNVVTISQQNQCDVWSKFRMGYRGNITETRQGSSHNFHWVQTEHNAYQNRQGGRSVRVFAYDGRSTWICIDVVDPNSVGPVIGHLHIGATVQLTPSNNDKFNFDLSDDQFQRKLLFLSAETVDVAHSWYCPAFGIRQTAMTIVYSATRGNLVWVLTNSNSEFSLDTNADMIRISMDKTLIFDWKKN